MSLHKRTLGKLASAACWLLLGTLLIETVDYVFDARLRAHTVPKCRWTDNSPAPDPFPYLARWCFLTKEVVMLRLYDKEGRTLLAERMFDYPDFPRIYWKSKKLGYQTLTGDDEIALPPSKLDLWRTRLP
ncbi:hypothetical protein [Pseudacidovorax intermedius]|uniref:hypothetical protein n=1 Tax=Pseudacidovorax intermedius TaxID=433924 RepID=UPI0026F21FCD|nr:hypothetical protein [Pseudacidovorax intermedius]